MNLLKRLSIALTVIAVSALSAAAQSPVVPGDINGQTLNPGDQLRIVVYKDANMTCDCVVAGNGTIIHPLYRDIVVTGVPLSVVEERIRTFLLKYLQTPQFVIQPLVKIVVRGEVKSPTIYSVPPETTIAQAIILAGGATDRGRLDDIVVIRDRQRIKLDLSRPDTDAATLPVRSNDQIIVGRQRQSPLQYVSPIASSMAVILGLVNIFRR